MTKESEIIDPDSGVDIVIIDIECTCDDAKNLPRTEMEIIEIGAVFGKLTDVSFVLVDAINKPSIKSISSPDRNSIGQ